ncbi:PepSY domain-containing protein [Altererythrobacter sp. MF3-039]|uniref:PepSY domain-containing protein n=1 Tax=Altererythrobacter sp. MF3-039 TaxID=3252901 RepID=UPI00390C836F
MTFPKAPTYRLLRSIHKWAGLVAALWLFVMGVTGVVLDHHEWRWVSQNSVPSSWTSDRVEYLVPGTVMRHIAVEDGRIVGGSERGAWYSDDGENWSDIDFDGLSGQPQVTGIADLGGEGFARTYLASDEGIWELSADGTKAARIGLPGEHLTSISEGHGADELMVVADMSDILTFDLAGGDLTPVNLEENVTGLSPEVKFHRFIMDIHFGRALLPGNWGIWLNDLGGVAMAVLSLTGILYWFVTRRGRRKFMTMKTQRRWMQWLFRAHAPIIGLLGLVPLLYISISAIPLNHIYGFLDWADGKTVARESLPSAYQLASFDHQIDGVAAWPGEPGRISIATSHGLLETTDNGQSWATDLSVPVEGGAPGANIFRVGDTMFAGFGGGRNFLREADADEWSQLEGTSTAITSAARDGEQVYVKNSQQIYHAPTFTSPMEETGTAFTNAAPGTTLFLFLIDVHLGLVIHSEFKWANDLFAVLAIILALSGPVMWLRRKWI